LPVSLDCLCLVTVLCTLYVASFSGLSLSCDCLVYPICCQFLWIVFVLCLSCVSYMLPVSLDCLCLVTVLCTLYVASFSGLSLRLVYPICCQFLWIVPSVFSSINIIIEKEHLPYLTVSCNNVSCFPGNSILYLSLPSDSKSFPKIEFKEEMFFHSSDFYKMKHVFDVLLSFFF
jgi:hypothetical protein